jgi:hypothetical protein
MDNFFSGATLGMAIMIFVMCFKILAAIEGLAGG